MSEADDDARYRHLIDRMVEMNDRSRQFYFDRTESGIWNRNARPGRLEDQHRINLLLERLDPTERKVLGSMLGEASQLGVMDALVVLDEEGVPPLDSGYEGDCYHDFIGRANGWEWPLDGERTRWR